MPWCHSPKPCHFYHSLYTHPLLFSIPWCLRGAVWRAGRGKLRDISNKSFAAWKATAVLLCHAASVSFWVWLCGICLTRATNRQTDRANGSPAAMDTWFPHMLKSSLWVAYSFKRTSSFTVVWGIRCQTTGWSTVTLIMACVQVLQMHNVSQCLQANSIQLLTAAWDWWAKRIAGLIRRHRSMIMELIT